MSAFCSCPETLKEIKIGGDELKKLQGNQTFNLRFGYCWEFVVSSTFFIENKEHMVQVINLKVLSLIRKEAPVN